MTAFDYATLAATATRLLNRFGRAMQVKRAVPGTYDPVTGQETGASTLYANTIGAFMQITTAYAATHEVQQGDRLALIDATIAPELTDALVVGASELVIVNIESINPAGTPLAYRMQVRGAVDDSGAAPDWNIDGGNAFGTGIGSISGGGA